MVPGETKSEVTKELRLLFDKKKLNCEITQLGSRKPVELSNNSVLPRTILDVMDQMNIQSNTICFTGATDNEHIFSNSVESLVWGPGDLSFAHSVDERISINDMKNAAIALGLVVNKLLE